jgi:hypothetical protein
MGDPPYSMRYLLPLDVGWHVGLSCDFGQIASSHGALTLHLKYPCSGNSRARSSTLSVYSEIVDRFCIAIKHIFFLRDMR